MRLLDRYLLRELLLPLGMCLGGFLVLWVTFDVFAQLPDFHKQKLHGPDIAELYLAQLPEIIVLLFPMALLLALLYALTQHAKHNEITAMRAAGIGLWRLAAPYFAVGVVSSLALLALNELLVPPGTELAEEIQIRRVRPAGEAHRPRTVNNLGFTNAREQRSWQISQFNLATGEMLQPQVNWTRDDGTVCWLFAERGLLTNGAWAFVNAREIHKLPANTYGVPVVQTNFLQKPDFTESLDEIRSEVKVSGYMSMRLAKSANVPIADLVDYLGLHPQLKPGERAWLYTKLHGRFAAPWTCLVVVLIALPFGAASGRRNVFVGVASSIFICFVFFVVLQLGLALGSGGWLPPWLAAWLPNLLFGGVAVALIRRVR